MRKGRPRNLLWRGGALVVIALCASLWIVVGAMAWEVLPGSTDRIDLLFDLALVASYLGPWLVAVLWRTDRRRVLLRALTSTGALLVVLLALEIPAAMRAVHWTILFRRATGEGFDYGTAYVHDAHMSFRRIPNLTWTGRPQSDVEQGAGLPPTLERPITFTYDRWGYRNAVEMETAEVVLLGDSYVEGWYVSDDETVASRLADELGTTVASLGVAGYGALDCLEILRGDAMVRQPRVAVWFFFEGNDLYDDQRRDNWVLSGHEPSVEETTPHREGASRVHGWRERSFTLNLAAYLRRWAHPLIPNRVPYWALLPGRSGSKARIYFADYALVPWTAYEEGRWSRARAAFEEGMEFARGRGIELLFVFIPFKYRVYEDVIEVPAQSPVAGWSPWTEAGARFSTFCEEAGARCLDLTEPFTAAAERGEEVYARVDTHWGPAGHLLAALEIADRLRPAAAVSGSG